MGKKQNKEDDRKKHYDKPVRQSVWMNKLAGCQEDAVLNGKCTRAIKLLDKILDYPAELESFTIKELKNYLRPTQLKERLDFLLENDALTYDPTSETYYVNHSNNMVAMKAKPKPADWSHLEEAFKRNQS